MLPSLVYSFSFKRSYHSCSCSSAVQMWQRLFVLGSIRHMPWMRWSWCTCTCSPRLMHPEKFSFISLRKWEANIWLASNPKEWMILYFVTLITALLVGIQPWYMLVIQSSYSARSNMAKIRDATPEIPADPNLMAEEDHNRAFSPKQMTELKLKVRKRISWVR